MLLWIARSSRTWAASANCHGCGNRFGLSICAVCGKYVCPSCRWGYREPGTYQCGDCNKIDAMRARSMVYRSVAAAKVLTIVGISFMCMALLLGVLLLTGVLH
jgi:hypothetical protein